MTRLVAFRRIGMAATAPYFPVFFEDYMCKVLLLSGGTPYLLFSKRCPMTHPLRFLVIVLILLLSTPGSSQSQEDKVGAWYMYFFNKRFADSKFGVQGDVQFRNWNLLGDLEQVLLRGGLTYYPIKAPLMLTFGTASITTGTFGDPTHTFYETRFYQEAFYPHKLAGRVYLVHRFRYEQRFVETQDFRTRYRYNFFVNVPFNKPKLEKGAVYLQVYNEFFLNGQKKIGDGREVSLFDRNRLYLGLGYNLKDNLRVQLGAMQQATKALTKNQAQISLHHTW